jgi:hypothetical protein
MAGIAEASSDWNGFAGVPETCNGCRQPHTLLAAAKKTHEQSDQGVGWENKSPASSAKGDALEEQLTAQVEQDAEASLAGAEAEQLPETCECALLASRHDTADFRRKLSPCICCESPLQAQITYQAKFHGHVFHIGVL